MLKRKSEDLRKYMFCLNNVDVVRGCGLHFGHKPLKKTESEADLDSTSTLCVIVGSLLVPFRLQGGSKRSFKVDSQEKA